MKMLNILLVGISCILFGCSGTETREANVKDYGGNLHIHVETKSATAMNGVLEPEFKLTITNSGGKEISELKIVGEVSHGDSYNDVVVKVTDEDIEKYGGKHEIDFIFKKSNKMTTVHTLTNQLKYNFTITEIEF